MFYFLVDLLNFPVYYNHSIPYRFYQRRITRPGEKLREKCHQLNIVTDSISILNGL